MWFRGGPPLLFSMMRLIRWMMMLVAGFFVMSVMRLIMDAFKKSMRESVSSDVPAPRDAAPVPAAVTPGGELKKCEACGVYNAAANSVTKVRAGATVYYCSSECRAKAAAA